MKLKNDRRWESTKKLFIILLICLSVKFILSAIAFAEDENVVTAEEAATKYYEKYNDLSSSKRSIFAFACSANGWNPEWNALNVIKGIGVIGTYTDAAGGERTEGIVGSDIVNFIRTTYSAVQVVGLAYLILYFFISVMDKALMEQFNAEQLLKKVILLFVCMFLILNGDQIFAKILDFGNALLNDIYEYSIGNAGVDISGMNEIYQDLKDASGFPLAILIIVTVLDSLALYVVQLLYIAVIYATFVGRGLEMGVRYMFAPIGIAPLVHDGMRSSGARYIKQFAALAIQAAVALAIVFLSMRLGKMGTGFLMKFLLPFVTIASLFKAREYASDIVGVH